MTNKNLAIFLVIIAVIAIVLVAAVAVKNNNQIQNEQVAPVAKRINQPPVNNEAEQPVASQPAADSDVDSIESDLNSVSDDSFGEDTLSDTEAGL